MASDFLPLPAALRHSADATVEMDQAVAGYGKRQPFPAPVRAVRLLSAEGSAKETVHLELDLNGSGMNYEAGDALAVVSMNGPARIQGILDACGLRGDELAGEGQVLAAALREDFDIAGLSRKVLGQLAEASGSVTLQALLADPDPERLKHYLAGRELVDAIRDFAPAGLPVARLLGILRKLSPRLYSIASSPLAHPGEVHLTVAAVRYQSHGLLRHGVCSTFLADLVQLGDRVSVFVQPNKNFRLPADDSTPVIMVGPGTGIAPFRAFIEHRAACGSRGPNWLFMGGQHYAYDFLYQDELRGWFKRGTLARLNSAFSRDQAAKVYVQHRMREHGAELYAWLEQGAYFYICGDASRMAVDVHETLVDIVAEHGSRSREAAEGYVAQLKSTRRYQRDVY